MTINQLIERAKDTNCSDIHITSMGEISMRQYGTLKKMDEEFTQEYLDGLIYEKKQRINGTFYYEKTQATVNEYGFDANLK